jgi:hypothetical protein
MVHLGHLRGDGSPKRHGSFRGALRRVFEKGLWANIHWIIGDLLDPYFDRRYDVETAGSVNRSETAEKAVGSHGASSQTPEYTLKKALDVWRRSKASHLSTTVAARAVPCRAHGYDNAVQEGHRSFPAALATAFASSSAVSRSNRSGLSRRAGMSSQ